MMSLTKQKRRSYRLGRRAEAAEETRRRIVEATSRLHAERGIAGTSMKDIAERAGVSVGTVYHHFPTYPDAIAACGAYTAEQVPAPTEAIYDGAATRRERIERLVEALFDYYERIPALASVRRDRHVAEVLNAVVDQEADNRLTLAARAIGARKRDRQSALVAALVDLDVYRALRRQGFSTASAAERIAAILNGWLETSKD
jgi:AcrR family transcriptional regulator